MLFYHLRCGDFGKLRHYIWIRLKAFFGGPLGINIEITNKCNLRCNFCVRTAYMTREQKDMKFDDFKKIIDDVYKYVSYVGLFLQGEPLLHPYVFQMIKYVNSKNLRTEISTNGQLLFDGIFNKNIERLFDSKLDMLTISYDGMDQESYGKMRGSSYEQLKNNVTRLFLMKKILKVKKPYITLQMIISKYTEGSIGDFLDFGRKIGADKIFLRPMDMQFAIRDEKKFLENAKEYFPVNSDIAYYKFINGFPKYVFKERICAFLKNVVVYVDGTLVPCCMDENGHFPIKNIFQTEFMDLWNSEDYINIRKLMKKKQLSICAEGCKKSRWET